MLAPGSLCTYTPLYLLYDLPGNLILFETNRPMRALTTPRLVITVLAVAACNPAASTAHAAIALNAIVNRNAGFSAYGAERWNLGTGQKLFEYDESEEFESLDAISMGPDGRLYTAGNISVTSPSIGLT
jgi:hypothetical protein